MPYVQKRSDRIFGPKKKACEMQVLRWDYACAIKELTPHPQPDLIPLNSPMTSNKIRLSGTPKVTDS